MMRPFTRDRPMRWLIWRGRTWPVNPLDLGRKHRVVQPALRRALIARDRHCCYPGCAHTRWLEAHHVMHWIDGGKTSLDNTLLLCSAHHRRLHEGGFRIKPNHTGEWYFETAAGKRLCC